MCEWVSQDKSTLSEASEIVTYFLGGIVWAKIVKLLGLLITITIP